MSLIGYPTIGQTLQFAAAEAAVPALTLQLPLWLALCLLRTLHARHTFGTLRPTRDQIQTL
jgi:hypothetical protein